MSHHLKYRRLRYVAWHAGGWTFAVYSHYDRGRFFNAHPKVFVTYRGGNSHRDPRFYAGMPKQTYADDNTAFQCQSFLNFKKLFLETGASAKCDDFVVLYHFNTFGNYTLPSTLSSAPHSDWKS